MKEARTAPQAIAATVALGKRRPEQGVNRATEQGKGHHEPQIADHQSPLPNLL